MIEIHDPPAQHQFCELIGLMAAYVRDNPDGADRLREYMSGPGLWDTQDVCNYTGWHRTYIQRLVSNGTLPYIPGKPHKFVPREVKKAVEAMQIGGVYGRRKSKTTKGRK